MYCYEGVVHMSGYVMPQDEFPGLSDSMIDSDDEAEEVEEEDDDSDENSPIPSMIHYRIVVYFYLVIVR